MKKALRIVIEIDRSTLEWLVVEHYRTGWSVKGRFATQDEAHIARKALIAR